MELLRLESLQEYRNYLNALPAQSSRGLGKKLVITESERDWTARRILDLCKEKGYRNETHFLAVRIMDKFFSLFCSVALN